MRGTRGWLAVAAAVAVLASACSDGGAEQEIRDALDAATPECSPQGDESPAKALLRCADPSIAFLETLYATGTGIVVDVDGERYIATNFHVVEPFDAVRVTVGGDVLSSVPLVGADVAADIALLGPLDEDVPPLNIAPGDDLERGDDVYLIGYPGESTGDEHETTISSGIVSRLREVDEWGQLYVQTDAAIAGGQSGGPLFDRRGRLVGISGLSFAEEYALVLAGADVLEALERIAAGDGDDVLTVPARLPADGGGREGTVQIGNATDYQLLFLPPASKNRTWHLTIAGAESSVAVYVSDATTFDTLAQNAATVDLMNQLMQRLSDAGIDFFEEDFDVGSGITDEMRERETTPGSFTIDVDANHAVEVSLSTPIADGPVDVAWTSDLELWPGSLPIESRTVEVGATEVGLLNAFDTSIDFLVELDEGQEVEVWARSPQGDVAVTVVPPNVTYDAITAYDPSDSGITELDDSEAGLYGLDVRENFTAETAGVHRFQVYSYDITPLAFRFSVTDA